MNKKDFSVILRRLRNKLFLTQNDISLYADIPLQTYKLWELAECLPSIKNIKKLIDFFERSALESKDVKELQDCYNTIKSMKAERDFTPTKNNTSCKIIIGIKESVYPNIKSLGFIGDVPSRIKNDEHLSLEINVEVNKLTNENPNKIIPGVKFSNL